MAINPFDPNAAQDIALMGNKGRQRMWALMRRDQLMRRDKSPILLDPPVLQMNLLAEICLCDSSLSVQGGKERKIISRFDSLWSELDFVVDAMEGLEHKGFYKTPDGNMHIRTVALPSGIFRYDVWLGEPVVYQLEPFHLRSFFYSILHWQLGKVGPLPALESS